MRSEFISQPASNKRATLASEVANKIVGFIEETGINPGERIPSEFELSEMFGVGRGTVREAVKQLVALNILKILPAKGTFVSENMGLVSDPLGLEFVQDGGRMVEDLTDIRMLLECYAARKAAANIDGEKVAALKAILTELDENITDNKRCLTLDIDFHKALAECSGNSVLPILSPIIHSNMFHYINTSLVRDWPVINASHWAVVNAIEQGNPALAEAEMVKHLSYVLGTNDSGATR